MQTSSVISVLTGMLTMLSPNIKIELVKAFDALAEKAKATSNPIDDIMIMFVRSILGL